MSKKTKLHLIKKEIVEELRSIKSLVIVFLLNIILLICVATMFYSVMNNTNGSYTSNYKAVLYMYNNWIFIEFIVILIIIPIISGCSYSKEFEKGTLDLLLLSNVKTSDIIQAKLIKLIVFNSFLVLTTLPLLCIVFSVGGVSVWDMVKYIIVILATTLYFGSFGIYLSVKYEDSVKAVVRTYLIEIVLTLGIHLLLNIVYNIVDAVNNINFYKGVSGTYTNIQLENVGTFLIINPMFDLFKLQSDVVGNASSYDVTMNKLGINPVVEKLWVFISVAIFVIVAMLMVKKTKKILLNKYGK